MKKNVIGKKQIHHENGYITLISILIVGAVGASVSISLILLGLGSSRTSFALEQSNQAKNIANTCAEQVLEKIRNSHDYEATGSLTLGQGTCNYTVSLGTGQARTIAISATVGSMMRKIKILIDEIIPQIHVTSWQEVP